MICAQDLAQLRAIYGRDRAESWGGMIGTKIITRLNAGNGAEEASRMLADQEIEREERHETLVDGKVSVTTVRRREIRRVMTASEIATRLGPRDRHIDVLAVGIGDDALQLKVPYVTLPTLRPGHVPAAWVKGHSAIPELIALEMLPQRRVPRLSKDAIDRIRDIGE